MPWYEVRLTSAQAAAGEYGRIQDQFEQFFHLAHAPPDMAMFSHQEPGEDTLHLYFLLPGGDVSEAFVRVAGAKPCSRPPSTAAFAAGDNETLERFRRGDPL
jgi:hypothetical protein